MFGNFRTKKFSDIYNNINSFLADYTNIGIPNIITTTNVTTLYYLLYARYGNSTIANFDENQFKYKLFSIIWQYGPNWEKELSIQTNLRGLTEDDIREGSRAIYNKALNPSTEPTTEELDYVSEQNTTKYKKSKIEGYGLLMELLRRDVTEDFLKRFKSLFITIVEPYSPLWYEEDSEEGEV